MLDVTEKKKLFITEKNIKIEKICIQSTQSLYLIACNNGKKNMHKNKNKPIIPKSISAPSMSLCDPIPNIVDTKLYPWPKIKFDIDDAEIISKHSK